MDKVLSDSTLRLKDIIHRELADRRKKLVGEISRASLNKDAAVIAFSRDRIHRRSLEVQRAQLELDTLNERLSMLDGQINCNSHWAHRFEDMGGGQMGARFEEKCKLCGYTNLV